MACGLDCNSFTAGVLEGFAHGDVESEWDFVHVHVCIRNTVDIHDWHI